MKFTLNLIAVVAMIATQLQITYAQQDQQQQNEGFSKHHDTEEERVKRFERKIVETTTGSHDKTPFFQIERESGRPLLHDEPEEHCDGMHHLCATHSDGQKKPVILQAGHHSRSKTDAPLIGILTQPLPENWQNHPSMIKHLNKADDTIDNQASQASFFEASHAEFLMAGGARVVTLDFQMKDEQLFEELAQLNGVYIPGDCLECTLASQEFIQKVKKIMFWAETHNKTPQSEEDSSSKHFPVVGMGYGMLAMLQSQFRFEEDSILEPMPEWMVHEALQQNLHLLPKETFVYDEWLGHEVEQMFDKVNFYNEIAMGVALEKFTLNKFLRPFVPVATYNAVDETHHLDEFVSMFEGTAMPYYGFAHRLDKVQFGFHAWGDLGQGKVDHSKFSIDHAQHVANYIVDEARLSSNYFQVTNDEQERLATNLDVVSVTLPQPHGPFFEEHLQDFYKTELYIIQ